MGQPVSGIGVVDEERGGGRGQSGRGRGVVEGWGSLGDG